MANNNTNELSYRANPEAFKKAFEEIMKLCKDPKKIMEFAKAFTGANEEMKKFIASALAGEHPENKFLIDEENKKIAKEAEKKLDKLHDRQARYDFDRWNAEQDRIYQERKDMAQIASDNDVKKYESDNKKAVEINRDMLKHDIELKKLNTNVDTGVKLEDFKIEDKEEKDDTKEESSDSSPKEGEASEEQKSRYKELEDKMTNMDDEHPVSDEEKKEFDELKKVPGIKEAFDEFFCFKSNSLLS